MVCTEQLALFHQITKAFFYVIVNTEDLLLLRILKRLLVTIIVSKYTAHQQILEQ